MIKINLYPGKGTGAGDASSVDFNTLSIKGLIGALVCYIVTSMVIPYFYNKKLSNYDTKIENTRNEMVAIKKRLRVLKDLNKEIKEAEREEKFLQSQHKVLQEVMSRKRNPLKVLLYISRNIPENTWVTSYREEFGKLELKGKSFNYSLIGKFFDSMEGSIFFERRPRLKTQSVSGKEKGNILGKRLEEFLITGQVKQFE